MVEEIAAVAGLPRNDGGGWWALSRWLWGAVDVEKGLYWVALLVIVVLILMLSVRVWEAAVSRLGAPVVWESGDVRVV